MKSFFLGPQAENGLWLQDLVSELLNRWLTWRRESFSGDGTAISSNDQIQNLFREQQARFHDLAIELSSRFEKEIPKFSPRYMGHMFSELSLPALIGHWIATLHNPNTISSESAPVGVEIEREAIVEMAKMAGYPLTAAGHFTSCGSIANFEAALRARDRLRKPISESVLLVPNNKHYSWVKAAHLLGFPRGALWPVELDSFATMDVADLKRKIALAYSQKKEIAMVVSVLGSTELGNIDSIHEIQETLAPYKIWHHVDGAYGGFFLPLKDEPSAIFGERVKLALKAVAQTNSITIDPHKLGYVPYACGAFLCREEIDYRTQVFDSPYIQYSGPREPGPFTIEGSRSATGAAATWLTLKAIGSDHLGYGRIVGRAVQLRKDLSHALVEASSDVRIVPSLDTNVLCFTLGKSGAPLSNSNLWVKNFYETHSRPTADFMVSKTSLNLEQYREMNRSFFKGWNPSIDSQSLDLIRLTLMNPFLKSKEMKTQVLDEFCLEVARATNAHRQF